MCFVVDSDKEKIAVEDITCYKVLIAPSFLARFFYFYGQFTYFKYWFWYKYFPCKKVNIEIDFEPSLPYQKTIEKGYHSYRNSSANVLQNYYNYSFDNNLILVEFIIPKGTRYFENKTEYASERIRLKYAIKGNELRNKIKEFKKLKEELELPQKINI